MDHPRVQRWVKLRTDRKSRESEDALVLTSPREIEEVLTHAVLKTLITSADFTIPASWPNVERVVVSSALLQKITGVPSPQGCAAEVSLPKNSSNLGDWVVILDGVGDPGNLGTILRSALALGWTGAWILPGTVDVWNDKALRSSKGAGFKLPLYWGSQEEFLHWAKQKNIQVLVADLQGNPVSRQPAPCALVLGSEAHGPISTWSNEIRVTIPHLGEMESLNVAVAGGILMAAVRGVI